jgi:hypothetical protein
MLTEVPDARELYRTDIQQFSIAPERFYEISGLWVAIMQHTTHRTRTYDHIAFKIPDHDYDLYHKRIVDFGLEIKAGRPRISGEARSLYFYDQDNHLFELHTGTLAERLKSYRQLPP